MLNVTFSDDCSLKHTLSEPSVKADDTYTDDRHIQRKRFFSANDYDCKLISGQVKFHFFIFLKNSGVIW